jgi:hypothetical protein
VDDSGLETLEQHRHIGALHHGQVVDVVVDEIGETMQILGTRSRGECRPFRKCIDGCSDGAVRGQGVAAGDIGQLPIPVERGSDLKCRLRANPLATDVVVGGDGDV